MHVERAEQNVAFAHLIHSIPGEREPTRPTVVLAGRRARRTAHSREPLCGRRAVRISSRSALLARRRRRHAEGPATRSGAAHCRELQSSGRRRSNGDAQRAGHVCRPRRQLDLSICVYHVCSSGRKPERSGARTDSRTGRARRRQQRARAPPDETSCDEPTIGFYSTSGRTSVARPRAPRGRLLAGGLQHDGQAGQEIGRRGAPAAVGARHDGGRWPPSDPAGRRNRRDHELDAVAQCVRDRLHCGRGSTSGGRRADSNPRSTATGSGGYRGRGLRRAPGTFNTEQHSCHVRPHAALLRCERQLCVKTRCLKA